MLKLGRMHRQLEEMFVDPTAMSRQMRGLRLLEGVYDGVVLCCPFSHEMSWT